MEYERFTEKQKGKNVIPLRNAVCGVDLPKWSIYKHSDIQSFLSGDAVDRLAELEDDLESGKIIRLPCEVDSEIYIIDHLTDDEDKKHYYIRKSTFHPKWIDEWRNMFCLTREEAEAKLKELQE